MRRIVRLARYRALVRQYPRGMYYNTLAAVEYRMDYFKDAIDAAMKSVELTLAEMNLPSPHPIDFAVLALSHFKLGDIAKAFEYRDKLETALKLDYFKADKECKSFATEVESLLASGPDSEGDEAEVDHPKKTTILTTR